MRPVTVHRPPWLAATCLVVATIALVPPEHRFAEIETGPRRTVVVEGEPFGDFITPPAIDPWMVIPPTTIDAGAVHVLDWHGDPHIFLNTVPKASSSHGLDDLLSGLWKLVAPAKS